MENDEWRIITGVFSQSHYRWDQWANNFRLLEILWSRSFSSIGPVAFIVHIIQTVTIIGVSLCGLLTMSTQTLPPTLPCTLNKKNNLGVRREGTWAFLMSDTSDAVLKPAWDPASDARVGKCQLGQDPGRQVINITWEWNGKHRTGPFPSSSSFFFFLLFFFFLRRSLRRCAN